MIFQAIGVHTSSYIHNASLAASPRLDFGVSPNCASRLRK